MTLARPLTFAAVFAGYATVVLGGYVSAIGAGLACPDWPTCHGQLIPDLTNPFVAAEYIHRLAALLTGLFVVASLLVVWVRHRVNKGLVTATTLAFAILVTQVLLGMVTISTLLQPIVVTAHLAVATAFIAVMTIAGVLAFRL